MYPRTELVEHINNSMTTGCYGKRYYVEKLKENVDNLIFETIDNIHQYNLKEKDFYE